MKKFYSKTLALSLCLVLCISLLSGCGNSEISLVKDAPVPMDQSITFGQLFDSYQYCKDGTWEVKESDRGQKFVEFRGQYDILAMIKEDIFTSSKFKGLGAKEAADYCESSGLRLDIIAQFMINADGKGFYLGYLGYEFEGESLKATGDAMEKGLSNIINNKYFEGSIPSTARKDLIYFWHKFIITTNEDILLDLVAYKYIVRQMLADNTIADARHDIYFISIEDVRFDDADRSMVLHATLNRTDAKISQFTPQEQEFPTALSSITSIDLKKHIVESEQIVMQTSPSRNMLGMIEVDYIGFEVKFDNTSVRYLVEIKEIELITLKRYLSIQ